MIWTLRNISLFFWLAIIVALPASFYMLPVFNNFFPGLNPIYAGIGMVFFVFVFLGTLIDLGVKKILTNLIKEGQAWERAGIFKKAEEKYIQAIRLYDSFLLWPFGIKKTSLNISRAVSKFYLSTGDSDNENFRVATSEYLKSNPKDIDVCRLWLMRLRQSNIVTATEQDLLSLLADVHGSDPRLLPLIADIFIELERSDYQAQTLYARLKHNPDFNEKSEAVIADLLQSVEAENREAPDGAFSKKEFQVKTIRTSFRKLKIKTTIKFVLALVTTGFESVFRFAGSTISYMILISGKAVLYLREHDRFRFYLKTGGIVMTCGGLIFFMATTFSHLFKSKTVEERQAIPVVEQIPKPFTIQVAAYLKQDHADRYVDALKKKGLDASMKKVDGGGKTWFIVRVSQFEDKKSAADYGQQLKNQKVIDDFFVNNN